MQKGAAKQKCADVPQATRKNNKMSLLQKESHTGY
jgi:hypothetical protein